MPDSRVILKKIINQSQLLQFVTRKGTYFRLIYFKHNQDFFIARIVKIN